MDFCDFTLEHFLDSLRTNRQLFPDVTSLFNDISSFVDFKPEKSNQKFGAFSPLYIICQLLDGLIFIHNLGIVHRDLKPANIFIMQVDTILEIIISKLEILYSSGWTGEDRRLRSLLRPLRRVRSWSSSSCRHKVDWSVAPILGDIETLLDTQSTCSDKTKLQVLHSPGTVERMEFRRAASINRHVQPWHGCPPPSLPPWCWRVRNAEDQQQIEKSTNRRDHHAFQVPFMVHLCPPTNISQYSYLICRTWY